MNSATHPGPEEAVVLIVDDIKANRELLHETLEPCGYEILLAADGPSAIDLARRTRPDLILMDVMMPGIDGFETCRRLQQIESLESVAVLFITARDETRDVVEAYRSGGVDYVAKPFRAEEVRARVATQIKLHRLTAQLKRRNAELQQALDRLREEVHRRESAEADLQTVDTRLSVITEIEAKRWGISGLIGTSPPMVKLVDTVRRLQRLPTTSVLIIGESGTGKELVARAIHFGGPRVKGPFVPVNCTAIPEDLAESLLFGHVKGAFSGAAADHKGYFEMADGGTLFLDEIGDMRPDLQAKLLRVLESGSVRRVGASGERTLDVRVLAATNADLHGDIAVGRFRQDLYFRLARFVTQIAPLRDRMQDLPLLADHFLRQLALEMGMSPLTLAPGAVTKLQDYHYPGNVRELKNILERAVIESGGDPIGPEHLHPTFLGKAPAIAPAASHPSPTPGSNTAHSASTRGNATAEERILDYVRQHGSINNTDCRELLGVGNNRAWYLLRKMHMNGQLAQDGTRRWTQYRLP